MARMNARVPNAGKHGARNVIIVDFPNMASPWNARYNWSDFFAVRTRLRLCAATYMRQEPTSWTPFGAPYVSYIDMVELLCPREWGSVVSS